MIEKINSAINNFVWGVPCLILLIGTGILITICTNFFQITHFRHWVKNSIGKIFNKEVSSHTKDKGAISQFQSLCTALAATVGTGNIAGVAGAIVSGGPGAVFWMWLAAFFGMMTKFAENVLGIYYRKRNVNGEWSGGAMYYLQDGLANYKLNDSNGNIASFKTFGNILAILFSFFTIIASFGIGNMSQIHTISDNMASTFGIPPIVTGSVLMVIAALVVIGGLQRIAKVTEKIVPLMVVLYIFGTLIVIFSNASLIGSSFKAIFSFAFGFRAVAGGAIGVAIKNAVTFGFKRGIFSNEAGLGSSVLVHSNSNVKEPVKQGMWGIFEVFTDTIIVCTLTALTILTSGVIDLSNGTLTNPNMNSSVLVTNAFSNVFGPVGGMFVAISILLFAFSTVLGWSYYGSKTWEYFIGKVTGNKALGTKSTMVFKCVFVLFILVGAVVNLSLAWDISDTFNGLMALPNLIGLLFLSPVVMRITKNYIDRNIKQKTDVKPLLSADSEIQSEMEKDLD